MTIKWTTDENDSLIPVVDNTKDVGSATKRVKKVYADDAHFTGNVQIDGAVNNSNVEVPLTFSTGLTRTVNTVTLANTAVTAGSYTVVTLTIDAQGRITAASNGKTLDDGEYTPTLTNTTNIAASTPYVAQYTRIGSRVHVFGKVDIDVTSTGNSILGVSLPIASDLTSDRELAGTFSNDVNDQQGVIYADTTNNRATFRFQATQTANTGFFFHFSYKII